MRIIMLVLACSSVLTLGASSSFEARLSSVAIEGGNIRGLSADARAELEKHLALVNPAARRDASPHPQAAELTIVLGQKAPGAGEPELHTSYAKLVGNRLYLWGDDEHCPGTLFAVYGFLEGIRIQCHSVADKTGLLRRNRPGAGNADRCQQYQ